MRARNAIRWAWRNFRCGHANPILVLTTTFLAFSFLGAIEILQVSSMLHTVDTYQESASNVLMVSTDRGVDGKACDRLSGVGNVQASGGIRERPSVVLRQGAEVAIPAFDVSPGFADLVRGRHLDGSGVLVHDQLAFELGLAAGSRLNGTEGPVWVAGMFDWPGDGRDARLGYSILIPTSDSGPFDECWLRAWPVCADLAGLLRSSVIVRSSSPDAVQTRQVNSSHGRVLDMSRVYQERASRFAALGAAVYGLSVGYVWARRRRVEFADGLSMGQARGSLMLQVTVELLLVGLPSVVLCAATLGAITRVGGQSFSWSVWRLAMVCPLVGVPAIWLGAAVGIATIRRRSLYRYFKGR